MNNNINPALYAKHRAVLSTWNLIGKKLFSVKSVPADLKWNDKVRENKFRTNRPIMKYYIEDLEVTSVSVEPLPNDSGICIQLNNDPKYQYKLGPAKFADVSLTTVTEAVKNDENNGSEPIFFTDGVALKEQVKKLNGYEMDYAKSLADELLSQAKLLSQINKQMDDSIEQYYEELGKESANIR